MDKHGKSGRVIQRLKVGEDKKERALSALSPGEVAQLIEIGWTGNLVSSGMRVTILLHADNPGGAHLLPYQRADLIESLAALLDNIPCRSVKLIAFNLDEQSEVFRREQLDRDGFLELKQALERVQLATIPYQALEKGSWNDFLLKLVKSELSSKDKPDIVLFLGGSTFGEKPRKEMFGEDEVKGAPGFFYFRFSGSSVPDRIERLVKHLHGKTLEFYSPTTLNKAIGEMRRDERAVHHKAISSQP